jgi:hypothetical protein
MLYYSTPSILVYCTSNEITYIPNISPSLALVIFYSLLPIISPLKLFLLEAKPYACALHANYLAS